MAIEVAVACYPGVGHLAPFFSFGERLVATCAEISVTVFTQLARHDEARVLEHPRHPQVRLHLLGRTTFSTVQNGFDYSQKDLNGTYASLVVDHYLMADIRPVAVINGQLVGWGENVARYFDVPLWVFHASPAYTLPIYMHEVLTAAPIQPADHHAPAMTLPLIGNISYAELPVMPPSPLKEMFQRSFRGLSRAAGILCNDVTGFYNESLLQFIEGRQQGGPRVLTVGPLCLVDRRLSSAARMNESDWAWLNRQQPGSVVFVSLGSWCDLSPANLVELALGLEKCGQPVLWAHRGAASVPREFLTSADKLPRCPVDEKCLPRGWEYHNRDHILVRPWVNQAAILSHPAIGCFVTHCGWNSILESIAFRGLPLVALPLGAEQVFNSRLVSDVYHVGVRVWRNQYEELDADVIANRIQLVLTKPRFKLNALRLHRLARGQDDQTKVFVEALLR